MLLVNEKFWNQRKIYAHPTSSSPLNITKELSILMWSFFNNKKNSKQNYVATATKCLIYFIMMINF